ncbi:MULTISPECIES: class I SAM-dependent methyltransferase [Nitrospirillum]|uniref:O-methyltransferase involved in polyketide biosynthesis n=1 Tax=Nitrospirillum amazonense TaxID=28077 RepID=A0A560FMU8_9PROT|nr:class I SAM-dependent methyltransferase [Nitrospirillum amazonense]MEC4591666.1 class I SAM-dependent methyltransferase [Nitrospirillum amazonense]TWB22944.1 O-methyltransferase involved in polyketide biosynthesis [Nitrospirillum amazonense]
MSPDSPPPKAPKPPPGLTHPGLTGVPETMLWTLHNRAAEAMRPNARFHDPEAVRIYQALAYDYERHFGRADGSHAMRAAAIDAILRRWLERHPDGTIVSLGEGLETQRHRVDNGRLNWLTVDLPEGIALRDHFLPPAPRVRHLAADARDPAWMDAVTGDGPVHIVAQGLFMYLPEADVRRLVAALARRFPGGQLVFDTVPVWLSRLTLRGLHRTPHYRIPPMPWGIDADAVVPTLRGWSPQVAVVETLDYRMPRGLPRLMDTLFRLTPALRHKLPGLVRVEFAGYNSGTR